MTSAERFLKRLRGLDAAAKSALRASAASPHTPDVAAHDAFTAAFWPIRNSHLPRDVCRVVAALYLWYPKDPPGRDTEDDDDVKRKRLSLVDSIRESVRRTRGDRKKREQTKRQSERLVKELLAAPFTGLPQLLLTAVQRLAKAGVLIDWPQLIRDLGRWDRGGEPSIQQSWANSWLLTGGDDVS